MATLDAQLLEILACPDSHHAPLEYDQPGQTLTCTECARVFPIRDGVPVLLLDEARDGAAETANPPDRSKASDRSNPSDQS